MRRTMVLVIVALALGVGSASADHDLGALHVCVKNGNMKAVASASDCRSGEIPLTLATEAAVKRLHGYTAAAIKKDMFSGSRGGEFKGIEIALKFCEEENVDCIELSTGPLTSDDNQSVVTLDAANTPNFSNVVDRLTNGVDNYLSVEDWFIQPDGSRGGGSARSGPESGFFYRPTLTSSGPGYVDLAGVQIASIEIAVDLLSLRYDPVDDVTFFVYTYRVFFGLTH